MDTVLKELCKESIFKYFKEISEIPRGSGNEMAISNYIVNFAVSHNLYYKQDENFNVIIKKAGTKGYENAPHVMLQGHMDMVCDKNKNKVHDFTKDPIELKVKDDMIYACDTTLGGDDGIAIAYFLSILDSDTIPHPPLEVVMTVEEEIGLRGAEKLDTSDLNAKYLINLDSESEGKLLVSCAGGVRAKLSIPVKYDNAGLDTVICSIAVGGLKGGHSGGEINKGRGNSNKIMGRILNGLFKISEFKLADIAGGQKANAIPREADALLELKAESYKKLKEASEKWDEVLRNELKSSDEGVFVSFEISDKKVEKVFSIETTKKVIQTLMILPCGINTMSMEIKDLPESSVNVGIVSVNEDKVMFESSIRSCIRSLKYFILEEYKTIAEIIGADIISYSDYPEWQYNADSNLRKLCADVYKEKFGRDVEIIAMHGGVECGLINEKMSGLDMISFGPDLFDVHTPDEHLGISSARRTFEYLLEIIKRLK